jgi:DNA-directed RNA polymerase subunit D
MEIDVRKLTADEMEFLLSGADPAFANTLRRVMIREVPVMAIDEVEFVVNDSVVYDEMLSHTLGLVPLKTPDGYILPSECKCDDKRCEKCSVQLTLKKEGPAVVMSGDMKSADKEVVPVGDSIPLVKLNEGQKLQFIAIAHLGMGKNHAQWQPGVIAYKYMPIFELDAKLCDACGKCVERCPRKILELSDGKLKITDVEKCTMCRACVEACPKGALKIGHDDSKFIFNIESTGALPPEKILSKALDELGDKCKDFIKQLKKS